jgi:hypothetical protein
MTTGGSRSSDRLLYRIGFLSTACGLTFDDGLSFKGLPGGTPTSLVTPEFVEPRGVLPCAQ